MPSFVFKCDQCSNEIRLISAKMLKEKLSSMCFKCGELRRFVFKWKGNEGRDWVNLKEIQKAIDKLKNINT